MNKEELLTMVKANELRIGNWVFMVGDCVKVESVDEIGINRKDDNCDFKCSSYYTTFPGPIGIPLTPDILKKCGFGKKDNSDFHEEIYKAPKNKTYMDSLFFSIKSQCFIIFGGYYGHFCEVGNVIHLHQLQNSYFTLTNEELNIKYL